MTTLTVSELREKAIDGVARIKNWVPSKVRMYLNATEETTTTILMRDLADLVRDKIEAEQQRDQAREESRWRDCEEEPPPHDTPVSVWNGSDFGVDWIDNFRHDGPEWAGDSNRIPTHWRPLAPPAAKEETGK